MQDSQFLIVRIVLPASQLICRVTRVLFAEHGEAVHELHGGLDCFVLCRLHLHLLLRQIVHYRMRTANVHIHTLKAIIV